MEILPKSPVWDSGNEIKEFGKQTNTGMALLHVAWTMLVFAILFYRKVRSAIFLFLIGAIGLHIRLKLFHIMFKPYVKYLFTGCRHQ